MRTILVSALLAAALPSLALAQAQDKDRQACINAYNSGMAKTAKATGKLAAKCIGGYAKGSVTSLNDCYLLGAPKVSDTQAKACEKVVKACTVLPDFGPNDCVNVVQKAFSNSAQVPSELVQSEAPGQDIASCDTDPVKCKCQAKVLKATQKLFETRLKTFNSCKKAGLASFDMPITSAAGIAACLDVDPKEAIVKASFKVTGAAETACAEVPSAFNSGPCSGVLDAATLANCIGQREKCLACDLANFSDNLGIDCDMLDDAIDNGSCG